MTNHKQVNFTTVMDYRQTFTVDIDFESLKKHFIEEQGFSGVEFDNILQQVHKIYNKSDKGSSGSNEQILKQILHLKSKLPKNLQAELNKLTVEK